LSPITNRHGTNTECPFKDRIIKKVFEGAGQVMRKLHAKAELDRNRFRIQLPGKKEWDITFETDDDNYEKVKSILGAILSAPHHLVFGQNS
jgi:hypothetical protein